MQNSGTATYVRTTVVSGSANLALSPAVAKSTLPKVILYTDGACSGNPGPGGWAALLECGPYKKEISGFEPETTNNRMEMKAVIEGLKALKTTSIVAVHTDSAYIANAFNQGWIDGWKSRNWKTANKDPVKNLDLWQELLLLADLHNVSFVKVKGHANDERNNRVDHLAVSAIRNNGSD